VRQAGQIVLFRFPRADLEEGKLRPALLLGRLPGEYDDWLMCMISTQLWHCVEGFDDVIRENDPDYAQSGLKAPSVIRVGRLAVVEGEIIVGAIGQVAPERLERIKGRLTDWLMES
jgi:mRNA interferase MazF